ncbi:hypothetical protein CEP54_004548 [Fusarium duplospermum]|uniref:Alb1-domain-containing protein n=1 Tax=Fusarium duplospermum TaxID=1325734 RepID=A0A428QHN2_9HYPO|nr:hypothetical protein CEP54_004548 [Fusarium duplospermum]
MAKKKGASIHSRAARRATSPSIDADKSLKDVKPPPRSAPHRPSVLAAQHSAGVSKKSKRKTAMSAKARRRHEKGLEMAEAVIERTKSKVEKSKGRGRSIQLRSKAWEEINRVAAEEGVEEDEVEKRNGGVELDEDMGGADEETLTAPVVPDAAPAAVPLPVDDDDEIL